MSLLYLVPSVGLLLIGLALTALAWGQGPPAPPPSCEEQLTNEMWQRGGVLQQLAIARSQVAALTKERDALQASLAKLAPKPVTPEKK